MSPALHCASAGATATLVTDAEQEVAATLSRCSHTVRRFDYDHDLADLQEICAAVYGGTDFLPRIIARISRDPRVLILAAEAPRAPVRLPAPADPPQQRQEATTGPDAQSDAEGEALQRLPEQQAYEDGLQPRARVDGVICGERRGAVLFLYGLRVREGARGRGLGRLLMDAICSRGPTALAHVPDALPYGLPPPAPCAADVDAAAGDSAGGGLQHERHIALATVQPAVTPAPASTPALAPVSAAGAAGMASTCAVEAPPPARPPSPPPHAPPRPITATVTVTVSYNPAAQRIIGARLAGPLLQAEGWPTGTALGAYEAEAGWVRGVGLPAGAPHMLDCMPGARQALERDAAAAALLPGWRRAACPDELAAAVGQLLYGGGHSGGGGGGAAAGLRPLLWLPMPYEVCPLDTEWMRLQLAAGNVWLLSDPRVGAGGGGGAGAVAAAMVLTQYDTYGNRVCAGILAADSAATHAAIAHAAARHKHFVAFTVRADAAPPAASNDGGSDQGASGSGNGGGGEADGMPALYGATGGFSDFWVYGSVGA